MSSYVTMLLRNVTYFPPTVSGTERLSVCKLRITLFYFRLGLFVENIGLLFFIHPNTKQNNENKLNIEQFIPASRVWH